MYYCVLIHDNIELYNVERTIKGVGVMVIRSDKCTGDTFPVENDPACLPVGI